MTEKSPSRRTPVDIDALMDESLDYLNLPFADIAVNLNWLQRLIPTISALPTGLTEVSSEEMATFQGRHYLTPLLIREILSASEVDPSNRGVYVDFGISLGLMAERHPEAKGALLQLAENENGLLCGCAGYGLLVLNELPEEYDEKKLLPLAATIHQYPNFYIPLLLNGIETSVSDPEFLETFAEGVNKRKGSINPEVLVDLIPFLIQQGRQEEWLTNRLFGWLELDAVDDAVRQSGDYKESSEVARNVLGRLIVEDSAFLDAFVEKVVNSKDTPAIEVMSWLSILEAVDAKEAVLAHDLAIQKMYHSLNWSPLLQHRIAEIASGWKK